MRAQLAARNERRTSSYRKWVDPVVIGLVSITLPLYAVTTWTDPFRPTAVLGMGIPVLSVELVLVLFLGLNVGSISEKVRSVDSVALWLFAAFAISAALSMLLARTIPTSARFHYVVNILHVISAFLLFCRFQANDRLRMAIVWSIGGSLAFYCVIVVAFSHSVSVPHSFEWVVLGAGVTNVRQLAFYALISTGMAGALAASAVSGRAWVASTLLLFAGIFLCFWCGGRAAVGALCVQQAILVICARTRRTSFLAALAFCASIAIPLSVSLAPPSPLYGAQAVFGRIISQGARQSYDSGRSEIWRQTAEGILERPLFGHGEGQFRWEVAAVHRGYNHPHNLFLQFLYQWGCIGTAFFFLLLGRIARGPGRVRMATKNVPALAGIAVVTGLGAISLLDGPFFYPYPTLMTLVSIALFCSNSAVRTDGTDSARGNTFSSSSG